MAASKRCRDAGLILCDTKFELGHDAGGRLVLADYGEQPTPLMRMSFWLVQMTDGFEPTEHNRRGAIPQLLLACGFKRTEIVERVPTLTGLISIWRATKEV